MNTWIYLRSIKWLTHLLLVFASIPVWFFMVGFSAPLQADQVEVTSAIHVNTFVDIIADDGFCSLREAILAANSNTASGNSSGECKSGSDPGTDHILLAKGGIYSLTTDSSPDEDAAMDGDLDIWDNIASIDLIILVQQGGKATISQDAAVDDRVLHVLGANVRLEGLILTGGAHSEGGGILLQGGGLTAVSSHIHGNFAPDWGGGISNQGGTLKLVQSRVTENSSGTGGGVMTNGRFLLVNSRVVSNSAIAGGGGVWNAGELVVNHSRIVRNIAGGGGGIFNEGGSVTIMNDSQVDSNTASGGGGVTNKGENGLLTILGSSISGNSAEGVIGGESCGGVENWEGGTAFLDNTTVSHNRAVWNGAGLCNQSSMTVKDSIISNNHGTGDGGGVNNTGVMEMSNSLVSSNFAGWGGGFINGGTMNLFRVQVTDNTSIHQAGGIANWPGASLTMNDSRLSHNSSNGGGGLHNHNGGMVLVTNTAITRNTAESLGGGILNEGELDLITTRLIGNVAGDSGGGMFNSGALTISESVIRNNTATNDGDAVYNNLEVENAIAAKNNCIAGNGDVAVFNSTSATQDFTGNWWGDPSGPSGVGPGSGNSVSIGVDFTGWLTSPPWICPNK